MNSDTKSHDGKSAGMRAFRRGFHCISFETQFINCRYPTRRLDHLLAIVVREMLKTRNSSQRAAS